MFIHCKQCTLDNTKRQAGGPYCQIKNINLLRAGKLHRRAGQQAALQDGSVGCTLRLHRPASCTLSLATERGGLEGYPFLQASPSFSADRPFVQPAGPSFCLLCRPPKIHVFHLETRPSGPPALQLVLFCTLC